MAHRIELIGVGIFVTLILVAVSWAGNWLGYFLVVWLSWFGLSIPGISIDPVYGMVVSDNLSKTHMKNVIRRLRRLCRLKRQCSGALVYGEQSIHCARYT